MTGGRIGLALGAAFTMAALSGCHKSGVSPSDTNVVLYQVTGSAKHVSITYADEHGAPHTASTAPPFTYTWANARRGDYLYLSAKIDTSPDPGTIAVTISTNGTVAYQGAATGYPNIATATGDY